METKVKYPFFDAIHHLMIIIINHNVMVERKSWQLESDHD